MADLTFGTSIPTARLPGIGASMRMLSGRQIERQVILQSGDFGQFDAGRRLQGVLRDARADVGAFHLDFDVEVLEGVVDNLGVAVDIAGIGLVLLLVQANRCPGTANPDRWPWSAPRGFR